MQRGAPPRLRGAGARAWPPGIAWSPNWSRMRLTARTAGSASWLEYSSDGPTWSYRRSVGREGVCRLGAFADPAHRLEMRCSAWSASACLLSEAAGEGWIAVGDAAMAFDPIASQGLFNALSSTLVATGALLSADRLSPTSARLYSDAVATTFLHCEAGRISVYGTMPPAPQSWARSGKNDRAMKA